MFERFISYLHTGNQRSQLAKKNIIASFLNKGVAIIISLLLVPVTKRIKEPTPDLFVTEPINR